MANSAIKVTFTGPDGEPIDQYLDVDTGELLTNLDGYAIEGSFNADEVPGANLDPYGNPKGKSDESTPEGNKDLKKRILRENGERQNNFNTDPDAQPQAANNFRYFSKPTKAIKGAQIAGKFAPPGSLMGAAGMFMGGFDKVLSIQNNIAVNKAREFLGLEKNNIAKQAAGFVKDPRGYVADVNINDNTYAVGLDALDSKGRTTMTPDEARKRGMTLGGLTEATKEEKKQNIADFKADKKQPGNFLGEDMGPLDLSRNMFDTQQTIPAASKQELTGKFDVPMRTPRPDQLITDTVNGITGGTKKAGNSILAGLGLKDDVLGPSPTDVPTPQDRPDSFAEQANTQNNFGYGSEIPNDPDLPARNMAGVEFDLAGKGRSEVPTSGIHNKVADVVTDLLGPDYTVDIVSGMEPQGRSPVGSPYRHPQGFAADLKIKDPMGRELSLDNPQDAQAIQDVAQGMAARYNANFGMGQEYMGPNTMHIDTMDLTKNPGGAQWASMGKQWADTLTAARQTGVMPSQYYDIENPPTPGQRPEQPSFMIAENPVQDDPTNPQMDQNVYGFAGRGAPQKPKDMPTFDSLMSGVSNVSNPDRFKDLTSEEKTLMAMTIAGETDPSKTDLTTEAGRQEAMAILSTIENRAPKYGGVTGAITAPNQYSTWNNDAAANTATKNYYGNRAIYDKFVEDYVADPKQNLGFTSYHASTVNPGWSGGMQNKTSIGPHTFGFLSEYAPSSAPLGNNGVTPTTVFNTSATTAPVMTGGLMSPENAMRNSGVASKANQPATNNSTDPKDNVSGTGTKSSSDAGSGNRSSESRSSGGFSSYGGSSGNSSVSGASRSTAGKTSSTSKSTPPSPGRNAVDGRSGYSGSRSDGWN